MARILALVAVLGACSRPPHLELEIRDPLDLAADATAVRVYHGGGWSVTESLGSETFPVRMTLYTQEAGREVVMWVDALIDGAPVARGSGLALFPGKKRGSLSVDLLSLCSGGEEVVPDVSCALADPEPGVGRCFGSECLRAECGDGFVNALDGEICDDGNTVDGDGCSADCRRLQLCGDGVVDFDQGEECDDGNLNPLDGCYVSIESDDPDACLPQTYEVIATGGLGPSAGDPIEHRFVLPLDVEVGPTGGPWYVADAGAGRIYRIDPGPTFWSSFGDSSDARFAPVAGLGEGTQSSGDGGPAGAAVLVEPVAIAVDSIGDVYIADRAAHCIRRFDAQQRIETVAGSCGVARVAPSDVTRLEEPIDVAVDGVGRVYFVEADGSVGQFNPEDSIVTRFELTDPIPGIAMAVDVDLAGTELLVLARNLSCPDTCTYDLYVGAFELGASDSTPKLYEVQVVNGASHMPCAAPCVEPFDLGLDLVRVGPDEAYVSDPIGRGVYQVAAGIAAPYAGAGIVTEPACTECAQDAPLAPVGLGLDRSGDILGLLVAEPIPRTLRAVELTQTPEIADAAGVPTLPEGEGALATSIPVVVTMDFRGAFALGVHDDFDQEFFINNGGDDLVRRSATVPPVLKTVLDRVPVGGLAYAPTGQVVLCYVLADGVTVLTEGADGEYEANDLGGDVATEINGCRDLQVAPDGRVVAYSGTRVVRFHLDGSDFEVVAGTGTGCATPPDCGEGVDPLTADLTLNGRVAVAADGTIYLTNYELNTVRRVIDHGSGPVIETFVGGGPDCVGMGEGFDCPDGEPALSVHLDGPLGIALDDGGNLYVATTGDGRLWRVDSSGTLHWVAGNGGASLDGDGRPPLQAELGVPTRLAWARHTNLAFEYVYILGRDEAGQDGRLRRIILGGPHPRIETVAGAVHASGNAVLDRSSLVAPFSVTVALVPDESNPGEYRSTFSAIVSDPPTGQVRMLDLNMLPHVRTLFGFSGGGEPSGVSDGRFAHFNRPSGTAIDTTDYSIFVAESGAHAIYRIQVSLPLFQWPIELFAGNPNEAGTAGNDRLSARFLEPMGLALHERSQTLYVADTGNQVIRAIDLSSGAVTEVAGVMRQRGTPSQSGSTGYDTYFNGPEMVAVVNRPAAPPENLVRDGTLFISDTGNNMVYLMSPTIDDRNNGRVTPDDQVVVVAGTGEASNAGFSLDRPRDLAFDSVGNLYIAAGRSIRKVPYYDDTTAVARPQTGQGAPAEGFGAPFSIYGPDVTPGEFPVTATQCLSGIMVTGDFGEGEYVIALDACTGIVVLLQPRVRSALD